MIYFALAIVIGLQVIRFYVNYFDSMFTTVDKAFGQ
jgi:hypothetical protein